MGKGTILLIDDDTVSSQILSFILTDEGYVVELAENGKLGVEKVSTKKFDLVLLDFFLPDMKGHDASVMMKKVSPDTKIVLLTGNSNSEDEKNDKEYERVLLKPIHPEVIIKTISEILG